MHDLRSGELTPIDTLDGKRSDALVGELVDIPQPNVPVFRRGCEVHIGKGRFRVANFGKKFIMLEALPGTFVWSSEKV